MHYRSIRIFLSCMLVFIAVENVSSAMLAPSPLLPGQGSPFAMPGGPEGALPPGMDHMPTPAEMETMQKEFEQFLATLSPDDIKKLEKMGEEFILNNPDEAAKITGVSKEKLLEEIAGKESAPAQQQSAIEQPEPLQEAEEEADTEGMFKKPGKIPPQKLDEEEHEETITPSGSSEKNRLRVAIEGLIFHLESLQNKAASSTIIHQELRSYQEELRDLIFYLSLINTVEHNEHLTVGRFVSLVKALIQFDEEFSPKENLIVQPSLRMFDTPYDHLSLPFTATDKEIDKQYKKLAKKFKKPAVLKGLARDASETDKNRALKIARDSLELLTDDYKQLKDPQLRELVDAQIRSEEEQFKEEALSTKNQVVAAIQTISTAIYQQKILDLLIAFLNEYEPLELQKRKEIESAEKEQLDEQKKRFKRKGSRTPGGNFEPALFTPGVTGPISPYDGTPAGSMFGDSGISPSRGGTAWDKFFSPESSTPQQSSTPKAAEDKDKDKKETIVQKPSEAHQKAMKVDPRTPEQLIKDITRQFEKLNQEVSDEKTTKLFEKIEEDQAALEKKQGQDDSANESKGDTNGSKKESSEEDGKKDNKKDSSQKSSKPKEDGVQKLRSEKDDKESNEKGSKEGRKKSSTKKSSRKESLKKEPKVKAEVISWRKKTLGLDQLGEDITKLVEKKRYEPKATDKELTAVTELFNVYREPSISKSPVTTETTKKSAEEKTESEEEEPTTPPGIPTLKEKLANVSQETPKELYKTLFAKTDKLVAAIERHMAALEQLYQYQQQAITASGDQAETSEKKEERKKSSTPPAGTQQK